MATTQQNEHTRTTSTSTMMEINGRPFYIKSHENSIPRLYDIDTNEEVGYWCQKDGTYVMFSPYEVIMNRLNQLIHEDLKNDTNDTNKNVKDKEETQHEDEMDSSVEDDSDESSIVEGEGEDENVDEANKIEKCWSSNSVFIRFFILMFIYKMFQMCIQSIYVDFVFAFAFTILYTKMVKVTCLNL